MFLFKFQGLFYVAPAQDAFMCRLRFAGGVVSSHQMKGLADLADRYAGGYADVTTRANLQLREIGPKNTVDLLLGLHDLGIINRGAGSDNIRNITASPTSGFDPQELYDVQPLARELHHHILNHRELYGLPRKFNIAFDSGSAISVLEDTNDIGFAATKLNAHGAAVGLPEGIYFRLQLGGITGHQQFARDTGVLLKPAECTPVAVAIVKAFIEHGDRTDRKKGASNMSSTTSASINFSPRWKNISPKNCAASRSKCAIARPLQSRAATSASIRKNNPINFTSASSRQPAIEQQSNPRHRRHRR